MQGMVVYTGIRASLYHVMPIRRIACAPMQDLEQILAKASAAHCGKKPEEEDAAAEYEEMAAAYVLGMRASFRDKYKKHRRGVHTSSAGRDW
jgi:hypothetical protein